MFFKINKWWLNLNSATQYIIWIGVFCLLVASGVASLIFLSDEQLSKSGNISLLALGIFCLVELFLSVIIYLTTIWPKTKYTDSHKSKNIPKD